MSNTIHFENIMKYASSLLFAVVLLLGSIVPGISSASLYPVVGGCQMATPDSHGAYNATLSDLNAAIWCLASKIEDLQSQIKGTAAGSPATVPTITPQAPAAPLSASNGEASNAYPNPFPVKDRSAAAVTPPTAGNASAPVGPKPPTVCVSYTAYGACVPPSPSSAATTPTAPEQTQQGAAPQAAAAPRPIGTILALNPSSILLQGSSGERIRVIQEVLKAAGFFTYPTATGYFGAVTTDAVKAYQTENGLSPTGIIDRTTLEKIRATAVRSAPAMVKYMDQMLGQ